MIYFKSNGTGRKTSSKNSSTRRGSSSGWMDDHRCIGRTFKGGYGRKK